jgi:integrase
VSVEKRRKGGHTVYLARWREVTRRRARTFTRKADAEAFERERRREAALGAHGLARALPDVTRDWLRRWWDAEAAGWAPSTRRTQASSIDLWIEPYGGGVRLRDLGDARVRRWRTDAGQRGRAGPVGRPRRGRSRRPPPANPCHGLRRLTVAVSRPHALSPTEVELVRASMATLRDVALLALLAYSGLRPGEAIAIRWRDVGRCSSSTAPSRTG